jgi:hypothetical protein
LSRRACWRFWLARCTLATRLEATLVGLPTFCLGAAGFLVAAAGALFFAVVVLLVLDAGLALPGALLRMAAFAFTTALLAPALVLAPPALVVFEVFAAFAVRVVRVLAFGFDAVVLLTAIMPPLPRGVRRVVAG